MKSFFDQMKSNAEKKAKQMAAIELTVIDGVEHQNELKQYFGFTDKKIAKRKKELESAIK